MQIFLPYISPLKTAQSLDPRRLNKQVIECNQILKAISGESNAWRNHPIVKMYSKHTKFVKLYRDVLALYRSSHSISDEILKLDKEAMQNAPKFITEEYLDNTKKRLFTKLPDYYSAFAHLGKSYTNMYYVDGAWKCFEQDK